MILPPPRTKTSFLHAMFDKILSNFFQESWHFSRVVQPFHTSLQYILWELWPCTNYFVFPLFHTQNKFKLPIQFNLIQACKHKSYGQSSIEVSHGANISAETLRKTARSKDAEVVIRTGHAVAHPVSASHLDINHGKTSIEKAGQDLHQIVVIAMRYTRTFCSPYEVTFVAKSGPSTAINPAVTPVAKFPSSPGKWMMQVAAPVTLPIRSAVMRPIKATMNTFSVYEHAHKGQQSAIARRSKSMSTMQWPFQGLEFDFDHVRSPITEAELEAEAPAQLSDPKRMFELEDRV